MTHLQSDLAALRALLASGWTQGTMARDARGAGVVPQSREACEWCLLGGIERVTFSTLDLEESIERQQALAQAIVNVLPAKGEGAGSILYFNEDERRTQGDVLDLIDVAMAA